jgi:hypothetical protein
MKGHRCGVQSLDVAIEGERLRDDDKTPTQEDVLLRGVGKEDAVGFRRRKKRGKGF